MVMNHKILKLIGLSVLLGIILWVVFSIINPSVLEREGAGAPTASQG